MYIKYESTVLPSGECLIPKESEVISDLDEIANYFEDKRVSDSISYSEYLMSGDMQLLINQSVKSGKRLLLAKW